jgi:nucleoside-diphosphate-sugar epimerase
MKTALILGISGNFGSQMARALSSAGWNIHALVREQAKAPTWLSSNNVWVGDVRNEGSIEKAAIGAELIVYAVNPAYHRWQEEALQLLEPTVKVAEKLGVRILFPGNVYNFSPQSSPISENTPMQAVSAKGAIRIKMEHRLRQASQQGAKITIVRAGDFIGPDTTFTWMDMLLKQSSNHSKIRFPHDEQHVHFWSYLPDLCANTVLLMSAPQSAFEEWHDDGLKLSQDDWINAFHTNGKPLLISKFPWWAYQLISPVIPLIKEVLKMRYLWQQPVLLDGSKMKRALKDQYQATPLTSILPLLLKS